jgi:hypothetical protein
MAQNSEVETLRLLARHHLAPFAGEVHLENKKQNIRGHVLHNVSTVF